MSSVLTAGRERANLNPPPLSGAISPKILPTSDVWTFLRVCVSAEQRSLNKKYIFHKPLDNSSELDI